MSLEHGLAAMNLEMSDRVPRTEYSAHFHWELVNKVCGTNLSAKSTPQEQLIGSAKFLKAWNYDFFWNIMVGASYLDKCRTRMGHASYQSDNVDYDSRVECPFSDAEDALLFNPFDVYDKLNPTKLTEEYNINYDEQVSLNSDMVNMTGVYITCISGLLEIFGWDILLEAAGISAEGFGEVTNKYCEFIQPYFDALANSKAKHVMIHDDIVWSSGAFISPQWYRKYVFPNYKKLFSPLREADKKIIFTSDGNFSQFIDDIADCGVDGFVLEPLTDMTYIAEKYGKTKVFIGNADTNILLRGTKEEIFNEVKRCMDIGKSCPGYIMAVGNHIPSNTPIENALYYNECYEKLSKR